MKINTEVSKAVEEYLEKPSKDKLISFLTEYKKMLQGYLDSDITELELADTSIYVFVIKKEFFKNFPDDVLKLADIVDITHPGWTSEKKNDFIINMQKLIDNLLRNVSYKNQEIGKELEKEIMPMLIEVYESYIYKGLTKQVKQKAKLLHDGLLASGTLLSEVVGKAISKLFSVAYDDVGSGIKPLSKEEAKKTLKELYKLEKK